MPTTRCSPDRRKTLGLESHFAYIYTSGTTGLPKVLLHY
jgi:acyl-coenzyme A synthetase/AMP-(fatty) acid ligase